MANPFGAGGLPAAQQKVNKTQSAPSHDFKGQPNLPNQERKKLVYDEGKVEALPPTEDKIVQAFFDGFFSDLSKIAQNTSLFAPRQDLNPARRFDPSRKGAFGEPEFIRRVKARRAGIKEEIAQKDVNLPNPQHLDPAERAAHQRGELRFYETKPLSGARPSVAPASKPKTTQVKAASLNSAFIDGFLDELTKLGFGGFQTVKKTVMDKREEGGQGQSGVAGTMTVRQPKEAGPSLKPSGVPTKAAKRESAFFKQKPMGKNPLMK